MQRNKGGRGKGNRELADYKRGGRLVIVFFLFSSCLYLLVEVFIKVSIQSVLVMTIYMCLAALFADSRINRGSTISIKSSFMTIVFFPLIQKN